MSRLVIQWTDSDPAWPDALGIDVDCSFEEACDKARGMTGQHQRVRVVDSAGAVLFDSADDGAFRNRRTMAAARGPVMRKAPAGNPMVDKARAAWGDPLPDWIEEFAEIADARGVAGAAKAIGYAPSTASQVISNTYNGDIGRIEEKVRGALMGVEVMCPVLGTIGRDRCLDEQKRPFAATNAIRTRLYHACRAGCPHARANRVSEGS